ncbi:MAG: hypothetical protein LBQ64_05655, partial [Bacteroidales bacterium]|nr:hypothetical protein [Bacteroidales bacterium]
PYGDLFLWCSCISIDMNVLRTFEFPRQGIHINRKCDVSSNHIVRRTFTCDDLSKWKSSHVILLFP